MLKQDNIGEYKHDYKKEEFKNYVIKCINNNEKPTVITTEIILYLDKIMNSNTKDNSFTTQLNSNNQQVENKQMELLIEINNNKKIIEKIFITFNDIPTNNLIFNPINTNIKPIFNPFINDTLIMNYLNENKIYMSPAAVS